MLKDQLAFFLVVSASGWLASSSAAAQPIGCFKDTSDRDLPNAFIEDAGMTPAKCLAHCAGKGFAYSGVQYSRQCFCGNSYGKHGSAANCNAKCAGNSAEICGGTWANTIYATTKKPPMAGSTVPGAPVGCFKDAGDRDLPSAFLDDAALTPAKCIAHCSSKGYAFSGVQFSRQCFCGNSYGKHGPATNCNAKCAGNAAEVCGGTWANTVYATSKQ